MIDAQAVALTDGKTRFVDRFEDFVYAAAYSLERINTSPPAPAAPGSLQVIRNGFFDMFQGYRLDFTGCGVPSAPGVPYIDTGTVSLGQGTAVGSGCNAGYVLSQGGGVYSFTQRFREDCGGYCTGGLEIYGRDSYLKFGHSYQGTINGLILTPESTRYPPRFTTAVAASRPLAVDDRRRLELWADYLNGSTCTAEGGRSVTFTHTSTHFELRDGREVQSAIAKSHFRDLTLNFTESYVDRAYHAYFQDQQQGTIAFWAYETTPVTFAIGVYVSNGPWFLCVARP